MPAERRWTIRIFGFRLSVPSGVAAALDPQGYVAGSRLAEVEAERDGCADQAVGWERQALAAEAERDEAVGLLRAVVDPDPCWFDHHGLCQAHHLEKPCSTGEAQAFLAALAAAASRAEQASPEPKGGTHVE